MKHLIKIKSWITIFICSIVLLCLCDSVQCEVDENTMKAVALEQMSRFIQWPYEVSYTKGSDQFILGVWGHNKVVELTEKLYVKHKIKNKPVEVRHISNLEDVIDCHLVYIAETKKDDIPELIAVTRSRPILTITDIPYFAESGILVTLHVELNKLLFEINERAFHEAGLEINPLLLKVAKIVNPLGGER